MPFGQVPDARQTEEQCGPCGQAASSGAATTGAGSGRGRRGVTDAPPPSISAERASVVGTAGKWLSLFGALIAAGQAGTAWLHGYWQADAEKQAAQELALAELKDKSELAQQYLKVILDKDTKPADRALLLTALGDIEGHPLQKWAQKQYQQYKSNLDRVLLASKEESDAEQQGQRRKPGHDLRGGNCR